jgi:hypothetical protein
MKTSSYIVLIALILLMTGCNTGMLKTTTTYFDIPTGKVTKIVVTEETRNTVQDKSNAVGLDLVLPDPTGMTGVPAMCRIKLGWINNDLQMTPYGMSSTQTKDYSFMFGNVVKATQICGTEQFIKSIIDKVNAPKPVIEPSAPVTPAEVPTAPAPK